MIAASSPQPQPVHVVRQLQPHGSIHKFERSDTIILFRHFLNMLAASCC
jgi:hypothetical protein